MNSTAPGAPSPVADPPIRLLYRLDELPAMLGVSRRLIDSERAAGRFPAPDVRMGRVPLWSLETLQAWIRRRGGRA